MSCSRQYEANIYEAEAGYYEAEAEAEAE